MIQNRVQYGKPKLPPASMGHHHQYNTAEEKKATKAANSKWSYERFIICYFLGHSLIESLIGTKTILMSSDRNNTISIVLAKLNLSKAIIKLLLIS